MSLPPNPRVEGNLEAVFTNLVPVQDSLLAALNIRDILTFRLVKRWLFDPLDVVLRTQFNIDHKLRPWFSNVQAFRNLQVCDSLGFNATDGNIRFCTY
jgi:hypothetical protein